MTKLFKNLSNLWKINDENIDEDDIQSLSMLYGNTIFKFWIISIILISSFILGIIVGWLTKSTLLMMIFVYISVLSMFKWIELIQHRVRLHRNIVNIASNRGKLPYDEVLINLDMLGASIKLTKSAYRSYCMYWNFDMVLNNEES